MKRIDFLGISGSGKTTLIREIKLSGLGMLSGKALDLAASHALQHSRTIHWKRRLLASVPQLRQCAYQSIVATGEKAAFAEFARKNDAFLATAHESFALSGRSEYRRAEGYYHFIRTVRRIAFLEQWLGEEMVLFDESLSQKVYAIMPWDRGNEAYARRYFEKIPLPAALIHLDADAEQVLRQIRERERLTGKLIPGHRGLSDAEIVTATNACLLFSRTGAKCLQARGCTVLSLTASEPPEQNARRVIEFIQGVAP